MKREIPTIEFTFELEHDLKALHDANINAVKEFKEQVREGIERDIILVTEAEYKENTIKVRNEERFCVERAFISSKLIGIERPNGIIDVVDTFGVPVETISSKDEFLKKYFVDFI